MKTIDASKQEIVTFLQNYLQINTSHPHPDYTSVCAFFKKHAIADNFLYQEITLESGHPTIIITHKGLNPLLPSLILNHHMDVVPALNTEKWISNPFAGEIHDNVIIGRGSQDAKSTGVAHYFALKHIKDDGVHLDRTVHLVIVPDEEIGGFSGTKQFIETDYFKQLHAGFIIDEGIPSGNDTILKIKVSERKPLQITITTTGSLAHGSKLNSFNAIHELISILNNIKEHHSIQQKACVKSPAGLLISMNITSLNAGFYDNDHISFNVIPDVASATVDIRIPPTMKTSDAQAFIENIITTHTNSNYTIHAAVFDESTKDKNDSLLYDALAETIKNNNMTPEPLFFEGATDLRFYKAQGLDGVGFTPFTGNENIHGTNESLAIDDLIQGTNIMKQFLKRFCSTT